MLGEFGRDWSLPLLPAGTRLFESLPVGALVLDALAPAIGDGMITMSDRGCEGVLVVRNGVVAERVWVGNGVRHHGDDALAHIRTADTAMVSARKLTEEAMVLLGPLLHGETCYADLRLEWVAWAELLSDLRARGGTFLVELTTPSAGGVTCVREGRQVATFTDSHPSLGDPSLLDAIVAGGVGSIRVLVDGGAAAAMGDEIVAVVFQADNVSRALVSLATASGDENATLTPAPAPPFGAPSDRVVPARTFPEPVAVDDPNDTFSAIFGPRRDASYDQRLHTTEHRPADSERAVAALLPELQLLVRNRLQRSSEAVEEIVGSAAADGQSVGWLSDRVRVMTMRGFLHSTFDQLADDMLELAGRDPV